MERRAFVKSVAKGLTTASLSPLLPIVDTFAGSEKTKHLHIFHTNDTHSRIEPIPNDGRQYGGLGGVVHRAQALDDFKASMPEPLILDAGDVFQGTPYFNFFKGEIEFKAMDAMGYHATTLGNHDFDAGIDAYVKAVEPTKIQVINSNYLISHPLLKARVKPFCIFHRFGLKIGVFGLGIDLENLVPDNLWSPFVKYRDPSAIIPEMVQELRTNQKCDWVICLSHLGFEYSSDKISDKIIAEETSGIDLIIGGHTHTFLETPVSVTNKEGKQVFINQVGWGGINLGHIEVVFSSKKNPEVLTYKPIEIGQMS